jgi:hypothetical protein
MHSTKRERERKRRRRKKFYSKLFVSLIDIVKKKVKEKKS